MTRRIASTIAACMLGALLAACAQTPDNLVVLLDDPRGRDTSIAITTPEGEQTLDRPNQASGVDAAGQGPVEPIALESKHIAAIFSDALAAEPRAPDRYVLYFQTGGVELTPTSEFRVTVVLEKLKEWDDPVIDVVGHTDRVGAADLNARLAMRRAEAARDILVGDGVDAERIEVSSHGENNPLVPTADNVAEPRNRRVEITIR